MTVALNLAVGLISLGIEKKKLSKEAQEIGKGLIELYISEVLQQAQKQAFVEGNEIVTVEHVEKILPRLMMEF
jgi:histone H3/H4